MLSDVALPRLLEGVAASLRDNVGPHVTDRFALMQLRAIDELLRNLADRVEWERAEVEAESAETTALLERLRAAGWPGEIPAADPGDPLAHRAALLRCLREAMDWLADPLPQEAARAEARADAVAFLRTANERERKRLKSGMYG